MRCNLYKYPSRFLRTETDDIILNAKIFKGSRIVKTVLKRNTARETHDQMLKLTYSGKGGDTDHWDRCMVWKQVWSRVPTWLGTHLPSPPDGESKAFYGISLKMYFTGWVFCLYMCLWTVSTCLVSSVQERVPDRLELESWEVVSCRMGGGNLTLVLCENKCLPLELSPQPSSLSE